ncbi:MAG: heparinase II/III family protein, partial [Clostridia bacterium]|nr:heparinase II/III family protein [Clostridia bacterium]
LAEIKHMLIDRLDRLVIERITAEIDRRILKSFENEHNLWIETLKSNWAAVCGGSIGMTFMYESPERFYKSEARIKRFLENYLEGISDDGATSEGAAYWNYGFGFFMMYYDNFMRYTNAKSNGVLRREKVIKEAGFLTSLYLDNKTMVSFSDSSGTGDYSLWLLHYLKSRFDIIMPPASVEGFDFEKFSVDVRGFLYYNPDYVTNSIAPAKYYYDKVGWYIDRREKYGFAIKGGNNAEEHNHNDIGSFIVASQGKQIFCDLGAAEYTAANFGADRYKIFNNSSLGHSVPIINGNGQGTGKDYFGTLTVAEEVSVDMKNAYKGNIEKLKRRVNLANNRVVLTDEFAGAIDIKERFVTEDKPVISDNKLIIGNAEISFDTNWKPQYSVTKIAPHGGIVKKPDGTTNERIVYVIDFVPSAKTDKFKLYINF